MAKLEEMVLEKMNKSFLLRICKFNLHQLLWWSFLCYGASAGGRVFAKAKTNQISLSQTGQDYIVFSHQDSLFIIAATGEPRFKGGRDSCEKILVRDTSTLDYLLKKRLVRQTPRQRHYVEHLFALIADSGRSQLPGKKLGEALKTAPDSIKMQLLQIGSELKDSLFLPVARLYLNADSVWVRNAAVRSLGTYPKAVDVEFLLNRIEKTSGLERQENLWALEQHAPIKNWKRLLPILQDENYHTRQFVKRILEVSDSTKKSLH